MEENRFKVLIVDDEPEALTLLRSLLSELDDVHVVGEASNAEKALYMLVEHYPSLIFMDINMPGKTGMELVQLIRKRNVEVPVVFVSAYKDYAIEAIRSEVYDFLLKPVCREELAAMIQKYKRMGKKGLPGKVMEVLASIKEDSKIRINSNHSYILINPVEIVYCASEEGYTHIYLSNGRTEISNTSLTKIEEKVKGHNFFRLGRSVIINQEYIWSINKSSNSCVLRANENSWEIVSSHKSIKNLLTNNYNYA